MQSYESLNMYTFSKKETLLERRSKDSTMYWRIQSRYTHARKMLDNNRYFERTSNLNQPLWVEVKKDDMILKILESQKYFSLVFTG